MNNFNKAIKLIKKDRCLLGKKIILRFFKWLPDSIYLRILYRFAMGHRLNLKNPQTFTEKIQWLKLYDRKPEYTTMVDKYAVKEYVAERIGKKYVIPTLGVWDKPEQIDFDLLPGKFVLKTTHGGGGGGVIVCPDKSKLDIKATRIKLTAALKANIYRNYREWPYKNVPRRIIAEKFIEIPEKKNLTDYKVYCFNGLPRYIQVIQDRNTMETIDFFDTEWNHQEFYGLNPIPKPANAAIPKPANLQEMLQISKKLAKGTDFVRVDVYQVKDGIYFGELTFYPASGLGTFTPKEWNQKLGDLLRLNKKEKSSGMGIAEGGVSI